MKSYNCKGLIFGISPKNKLLLLKLFVKALSNGKYVLSFYPDLVIAQNLVDFEQLIEKCKVQIEKCKTKEKIYHNDY